MWNKYVLIESWAPLIEINHENGSGYRRISEMGFILLEGGIDQFSLKFVGFGMQMEFSAKGNGAKAVLWNSIPEQIGI